jgi:hypothetical protein
MKPLKAGSMIRIKLDNGRSVDGRVKAVVTLGSGQKYQVTWGHETARVSLRQIIDKFD